MTLIKITDILFSNNSIRSMCNT